ncbi:aldehyde dehydrogenase family protein [Natronosalvus halobius]|uniref:aldehyde dehydrogenase family protein n=1 Tax=Natronosalvus halobius TaxID=2953746 RepID=UPI00209CFEB0|nr:aldehyde dehydrogenase family protein [Natronosalvus halobius]USZ72642.1 aldehyde dehydrogenase family protein [Natronosalvus halobius]
MPDTFSIDADWNALYTDGKWTESDGDEEISVQDPSTREEIARVPAGSEADVDAAFKAAAAAQAEWRETPPVERERVALDVANLLQEYEAEIVDLLAHEAGGSRIMGETSVQIATDQAMEAATLPRRMKGEQADSNVPGKENLVRREPQGVVTVISPWNFPLNLSGRAVAPAIATGNAVVLKPASNTPITGGLLIAKLYEEAGLPDGLLNVVTGSGSDIGDAVVAHPESDVVAFTGSTPVGRGVATTGGENLSVIALELGGNNGHIVTADADLEAAVDSAVFGTFVHQGQVCISINRHIVHEDVYDEYVDRLTDRAESLPVGSAHDPETVVGPVIDESQRDEMLGYVQETVEAGATLETGGETVPMDSAGDEGDENEGGDGNESGDDGKGDGDDSLLVAPTVLSGVTNDMAAACNEHFGPIAPVISVSNVDEAVEVHNDTKYGLSGSVHAGDVGTGMQIAERMETGMVHVNDQPVNDEAHVPFSGTKASGVGGYNGTDIMDEVTEKKWISLQHDRREYPF